MDAIERALALTHDPTRDLEKLKSVGRLSMREIILPLAWRRAADPASQVIVLK